MKKILLAIVVGLALTVLFYVVGAFLSGGGHNLNMITAFFPYSLSLGILTEDTRWGRSGRAIAGALLVLQFPVYAIVFRHIQTNAVEVARNHSLFSTPFGGTNWPTHLPRVAILVISTAPSNNPSEADESRDFDSGGVLSCKRQQG